MLETHHQQAVVEHAGGLAPPLYMHSSVQGSIQGRLREGSLESEWEQRVVSIFRSQAGLPLPVPPAHSSVLPDEKTPSHLGRLRCWQRLS